jgi:hypothetical protein
MSKYIAQIDSVAIRETLSTLASDEFEGRGTGGRGGELAQKYITAYLDSCGVKPGNNGSFFQNINHIKSFNIAKRRFIVDNIDFPNDYKYENSYTQDTVLKIKEIIFVASGTESDKFGFINLDGKVVMKLYDAPDDFLNGLHPATIINIVPTFKSESSKMSENYFFTPPESKYKYNMVTISADLADKLIESTKKTLKEITDEVGKSQIPQIYTLNTSVEIHGNVIYRTMDVNNLIGIIEGTDLQDEYIILSAHHDHVGIIGEEIYNGADDNASGVSSVLEIARLLAKAKSEGNGLRRSVVFLFFAAEELGLIGSYYYVKNPAFPLTHAKACINVDMVGRIDDKYKSTNGNYIYIVNDEKTNGNLLEIINNSNIDSIVINTEDHNSLFKRSDHYHFAQNNIPAVLLTSGLHQDYHTPRDETKLIDFSAMWKRNRFIFSLIWALSTN